MPKVGANMVARQGILDKRQWRRPEKASLELLFPKVSVGKYALVCFAEMLHNYNLL